MFQWSSTDFYAYNNSLIHNDNQKFLYSNDAFSSMIHCINLISVNSTTN